MRNKVLMFATFVLFPGLCFAAESANYKVNTFSIDGGGGKSSGTSYKTIVNFGVGGVGEGTSATYKGQKGYVYTVNTDAVFDSTSPVITALTSSTHSSQSSCYSSAAPAYSWAGSDGSGIVNFYYALDQTLDVTAAVFSTNGTQVSSSTTSYTPSAKADGTWYFHLTAKDNAGNFSNVGTYTTCIDTTKPTISGVSSGSVTDRSAVISWTTNEASDSLVEYGTTTSYGSATALDTNLVTSHSLAVSGLSASTTYHYRVKSKDGAGNEEVSADSTFTTTATPDTTPPVISSVTAANITTNSATITWQTDEASDSKVDYGTTASYGTTVSNANNVTSHSVNLTGLTGSTTVHYRVTSKDASGNSASSGDLVFTTLTPDTTAPVVSTASISSGTPTENSATITFTIDESSVCKIDYGLTTSYGNSTNYETTASTSHNIALSGLSGSTEYHYAITCKDTVSPPNVSSATADKTFKTATPDDTTPPVISGVSASQITTSGAVVSWTTDEYSDSEVEYGRRQATEAQRASMKRTRKTILSHLRDCLPIRSIITG